MQRRASVDFAGVGPPTSSSLPVLAAAHATDPRATVADLHLPPSWAVQLAQRSDISYSRHDSVPRKPSTQAWLRQCPNVAQVLQPAPDVERWCGVLRSILDTRGDEAGPEPTQAEFLRHIHRNMRAVDSLQGGQLAAYRRVWVEMWDALGRPQQWQEVLQWLQGFPGMFCHPQDEVKVTEPDHARKVSGVCAALRHEGVPPHEAQRMLQQPQPPAAVFSNRFASSEDEEFAAAEVRANVDRGSVLRWPFQGWRPWVVLSLTVARNAVGKRRLVLDARYINLWLRYVPFKFETVFDVVRRGTEGAFMSTWDLKAGYHHVLMAPHMWTLLGFRLQEQYYVFSCLPFGLSQAPYVFTRIMRCAHEGCVAWGYKLTSMIDDASIVHECRGTAAAHTLAAVWLEAALGFVHAVPKCQLWPEHRQQFLGFVCDWALGQLRVPEQKLQRLAVHATQLGRVPHETELRSALGLLASCAPALKLTPLLGRWWRLTADVHRCVDAQAARAVDFVVSNLHQLNGKTMWQATPLLELNASQALSRASAISSQRTLVLACDASDTAYGAFVSGSEQWRMVRDLSPDEVQADLSSTVREVRGFERALQELDRSGKLCPGLVVQIWTDSQAAYASCVRMRGNTSVFAEVKALYLLAWRASVELQFVWVPREHEMLRAADELSKWRDGSDWRFSRTFARQQLFRVMGVPDIDCLASAQAHMCPVYYSAMYDGMCAAVEGMLQRWDVWPQRSNRRGKPLCWVFPPVTMIPAVLQKIKRERAEAIIVLPRELPADTQTELRRLRLSHAVQLCGPHASMVVATSRVPQHASAGGWKVPLQAVRVTW